RQLEALHGRQDKGSFDRLHIAQRLAETQAGYGKTDQAVALLQAALGEHQEARGGVLPPTANSALNTLVNLLQGSRHHDHAEKVLLDQLRNPAHEQQRSWLTFRLHQLYHNAVANDGEVSLGSGVKLYQAAERKLRADLATADVNRCYELINLL